MAHFTSRLIYKRWTVSFLNHLPNRRNSITNYMKTGWHQRSIQIYTLKRGVMDREILHRIAQEQHGRFLIKSKYYWTSSIEISYICRVWNVSKIKLNKDFTFPTTHDHSKWGVGDENSDWICVGDINRAVSRNENIICTENNWFW